MTPTQKRVVAGFILALVGFALSMGAYDVYLSRTAPDAANTFSWALQLWADEHPRQFAALLAGFAFVVAFVIAHIWYGQPTGAVWADAQATPALRIQVASLKVDNDTVRAEKRLIEGQLAHYRQRAVDLEFALSDCRGDGRDPHGYPPELRIYPGPKTES